MAREAGPNPTQTKSRVSAEELPVRVSSGERERLFIFREDMSFSPLMATGRSPSGELPVLIAEGAIFNLNFDSRMSRRLYMNVT